MRWKTENETPADATKRVARYYALWPKELDDGYTVWLEHYWAEERYERFIGDPKKNYWRTVKTSVCHPDKPNTGSYTASKYRTRNTGDY